MLSREVTCFALVFAYVFGFRDNSIYHFQEKPFRLEERALFNKRAGR